MPKTIQSYEIIDLIGAGGMGVVYKARHQLTNRVVAIKSLSNQYCLNEEIRRRFKNEAVILSKLDHPNIVKVIDFFELPDELHLIMEYVEGRTLDKIIGQEIGPIPYQRALPIFNQILDGIAYAHSKGVIHRDIKPSNIIVTKGNEVKITDFGIAKLQEGTQHTRTGTRMGTLYYMSPEQIRGDKTVDEQSDIYSLGMTLYEMLAGRLPFGKKGELTEFELMHKLVYDPLPDPREYYPAIPKRLVEVIYKALEKKKENRFISVKELKEVINNENSSIAYKNIFISRNINYENFTNIKTLKGHSDYVRSVAFSPDGNIIASGSVDKTIKLWETRTGSLIKTLEGHSYDVESVAFSPDGKIIASGSWDKTIKLWETRTGSLIKTLEGHSDLVTSVAFSPDGKIIASGSDDKTIKLWGEQ